MQMNNHLDDNYNYADMSANTHSPFKARTAVDDATTATLMRSDYCGFINERYLEQQVKIVGWVAKERNLGGVIFLDIRDREGVVQVVINPNSKPFTIANTIKAEYVVQVSGMVRLRPNPNHELTTGQVEIVAHDIVILNTAITPPIIVNDATTNELNRMRHRILDLRSNKMQHNLRLRHRLTKAFRNFLDNEGFIDVETPMLTRTTPGGAKDFLVPCSATQGYFYALPQSPQLFKQLLMVSGFDRYYQIVKCFRDEALRADRQPEFTQIDIETSFLSEEEIRQIATRLIKQVFHEVLGVSLPHFPVMSYHDALFYYGCDKPDLRIPMRFIDLTKELANSQCAIFANIANKPNGRIIALKLPSGTSLSRKEIDNYTTHVRNCGISGLSYMYILSNTDGGNDDILQSIKSPLGKFLTPHEVQTIIAKCKADVGDILLIGSDIKPAINNAMSELRIKIANDKNLYEQHTPFAPLWVIDFPLFEFDALTGQYNACHHPFTAPKDKHVCLLKDAKEQCLAKAYDLVLNGAEVGGGSMRIYDAAIQAQVFSALGISDIDAQNKFGFLLENLQYGAPPHGGIAFGLDRLCSIMCNSPSIRDVIAFPKTISGQCLLTNAPSTIDDATFSALLGKKE